jgi:uncharacterized protein (DUF2164 family)
VSYEKEIKDTTIRLTIKAITDVLREYKIEPQDVDKAIELGYNQGIDDAIKAVQLFLKVVEQKEPELSE